MLELPSFSRMLEWLEAGIQKGFWLAVSPGERLSLFFVLPTLAIATAAFVFREDAKRTGSTDSSSTCSAAPSG